MTPDKSRTERRRVSPYFDVKRDDDGQEFLEVYLDGIALLRLVMSNKGTAYTLEERRALKLDGLLPPAVTTIEQQVERVHRGFVDAPTPVAKYQFLRALQERNEVLFYALMEKYLVEMLPIVYTPTVGEAVQKFTSLYQTPRGISLSRDNIARVDAALESFPWEDVRMIVATDSSAILGIGDQGYGGLAIPIGKLALYTVGGGVSPFHTMPVALDVGTDRKDLLADPFYLGIRHERLRGDAYLAFVDAFVAGVKKRWPKAIIQWEDLSKETAFNVLERFRHVQPSFNDDIQGTGAVALAGVISAAKQKKEKLVDQRFLVYGAGAGGAGVATAIRDGLVKEGLSHAEAHARLFVLDSKGLLTESRKMEEYKRPFAQPEAVVAKWTKKGAIPNLVETIENAKITVLLGLSGQPGTFTEEVVRAMAKNAEHPMVFPLSNPTSSCEAQPIDILRWTEGRAIVATGSPFDPVDLNGKKHLIGQGNNAFIFPGLGFGAILCDAREITDGMVSEAAYALADYTAEKYLAKGLIYPPVEDLRETSIRVAARVIREAVRSGVATKTDLPMGELEGYVRRKAWKAKYLPVRRGTGR